MSALSIYDALRESHDIQRKLCTRLTRTRASNPAGRREVFLTLKLELAVHAAAEERFLYAPMLLDDAGLDSVRHALAEHHELDELVAKLGALPPGDADWSEKAKALAHEVRHHLKEEERGFFQVSGKILSDAQKQRLGSQYLRDYARMKRKYAADWDYASERAALPFDVAWAQRVVAMQSERRCGRRGGAARGLPAARAAGGAGCAGLALRMAARRPGVAFGWDFCQGV